MRGRETGLTCSKGRQPDTNRGHGDYMICISNCTTSGRFYWTALLNHTSKNQYRGVALNKDNITFLRISRYTFCASCLFSSSQSPLRLRANNHSVERSLGFHGSCGSLPREARVQAVPRARGSPMHTYKGVEITNVWARGGNAHHYIVVVLCLFTTERNLRSALQRQLSWSVWPSNLIIQIIVACIGVTHSPEQKHTLLT